MIIKSPALINFFGTNNITEQDVMSKGYLQIPNSIEFCDPKEVNKILNMCPNLEKVTMVMETGGARVNVMAENNVDFSQIKSVTYTGDLNGFNAGRTDSHYAYIFPNATHMNLFHTGPGTAQLDNFEITAQVQTVVMRGISAVKQSFIPDWELKKFNVDRAFIEGAKQGNIERGLLSVGELDVSTVRDISLEDVAGMRKYTILPMKVKTYAALQTSLARNSKQLEEQLQGFSSLTQGVILSKADGLRLREKMGKNRNVQNLVRVGNRYIDASALPVHSLDAARNPNSPKAMNSTYAIKVRNIAEFCMEDAMRLKRELAPKGVLGIVKFEDRNNGLEQNTAYSIDEFIAIHDKFRELLEGIDPNLPEKVKFAKVYERIASNIKYDSRAAYPFLPPSKKYSDRETADCRNLRNALFKRKTVCAGYADVLSNACALMGIKARYVHGPVDSISTRLLAKLMDEDVVKKGITVISRGYHAWVAAELDGQEYNFDPTWDHDALRAGKRPKYFGVSSLSLTRNGRTGLVQRVPNADRDMSDKEIEELYPDLKPTKRDFKHPNKTILAHTTGEKIWQVTDKLSIFDRLRKKIYEMRHPTEMLPPGPDPSTKPDPAKMRHSNVFDGYRQETPTYNPEYSQTINPDKQVDKGDR